jgi:hypothetical protein
MQSVGQTNNRNGRPPGSRNRRTEEIWRLLEARGDKDPIDFLSNYVSNGPDEGLRVAAANYILPYKHSKCGPTPAPRYVDDPISIPDFANIQEAQNFLADIARRAGAGELELASANDISNLVKNWVMSVTAQDELQLKIAKEAPQGPQEIHITGGLPPLPGTSINMSNEPMNGHNGHVIDHVPNNSENGQTVTPSLPQSDEPQANLHSPDDGLICATLTPIQI